MSDELVAERAITVDMIHRALNVVVFEGGPSTVEPAPVCAWTRLCGEQGCTFPTYQRNGEPVGLTAKILIQLGYPITLLKDLDREYEMSEVLHPGVKIGRSRNAALARIDDRGMALLTYFQERQATGVTWAELSIAAFAPRKLLRWRDARRRPWRY